MSTGSLVAGLPRVNASVLLALPDVDHDLPSRIEDLHGDLVVVAAVDVPGRPGPRSDGEVVGLAWATAPRGLLSVACVLVEQRLTAVPPVWLLRPFGPLHRLQRRRYARADVGARAVVAGGADPGWVVTGQVTDLSEGGARVLLEGRADVQAGSGDLVSIDIALPGAPVRTLGTLLGLDLLGSGRRQVRLQFDLTERDGERVRRAVMQRQLEARRGEGR